MMIQTMHVKTPGITPGVRYGPSNDNRIRQVRHDETKQALVIL